MRNRFEALGDIDDLEEEHDMILATKGEQQRKSWGGQRNLEGHGQEAKHAKR